MKKIEIRETTGRKRVMTVFDPKNEPSKTQQSFRDQVDVNNIMKKYEQTGEIYHKARQQGVYADLTKIRSYEESLLQIKQAESAFASIPAHIRARFQNDPAQLLKFLQDKNNYDEGVQLGLLNPKPNPIPKTEPIINDESNDEKKPAPKTKTKND